MGIRGQTTNNRKIAEPRGSQWRPAWMIAVKEHPNPALQAISELIAHV